VIHLRNERLHFVLISLPLKRISMMYFHLNVELPFPASGAQRPHNGLELSGARCSHQSLVRDYSQRYPSFPRRLGVCSVTVGKSLSALTSDSEPCVSLSVSHGSSVHEPLS
jgi:hypothetical protein